MRIAILQPTFLPWLGWFDIADQVDSLVILDDVAFSKQSWQQRNRLRTLNGLAYATVPVLTKGRSGQTILDVEIADARFVSKLERTISGSYAGAPYYKEFFPGFCEALRKAAATGRLSELNLGMIVWFFSVIGISTPWQASSTLQATGKRGEHVAALCELVGATEYLSPAGSEEYLLQDRDAFDRRHIQVQLHEYIHPQYQQAFQPFIPFASVLDLLLNEGPRALETIRSGRRAPRALGKTEFANLQLQGKLDENT
ncbi:WbqC family protein [Ottowia thiooxydans]|uniref:WbqC-like protein n=1 Tax=Ottowia thiooxydans TaxID=219182 RepID=A0ABV2QBA4_9BURK